MLGQGQRQYKRMSSREQIPDRMSENHDRDEDDKSTIALSDKLRDNNVRQQLIWEVNNAKAQCSSSAHISPKVESPQNRLNFPSSNHKFLLALFTILVIVYSSTWPLIATNQLVNFSTRPTTKLISFQITPTATEAVNHHHHVEHRTRRSPTELIDLGRTGRVGENVNSKREQTQEEKEQAKVSSSVRLPRTNIKINRTRRASDNIMADSHRQQSSWSSTINVCNDCLAIPMVSLVGHKQVNGFLLHPAPANLQRHQSIASSSSSSSSSSSQYAAQTPTMGSHEGGINRARGIYANYHDNNISHYGTEGTSQATMNDVRPAQSTSSYGVPLSTHAAYYNDRDQAQSPMGTNEHYQQQQQQQQQHHHHHHHRQQQQDQQYHKVAYERVVSSSPFEPKSDDKCPMSGSLTVCDQINSYPADAIVHRVAAAKRALHKAYFDIDSLFSDEADGFSEPFGVAPQPPPPPPPISTNGSSSGRRWMMSAEHKPSPSANHDNMTAATLDANLGLPRQHYENGHYHQSAPVSTSAYQAYDQKRANNGEQQLRQPEQIEEYSQAAQFAKRAPVIPSRPEAGNKGTGSSGQSGEPTKSLSSLSSGIQRSRQQAKRSYSSSPANLGAPVAAGELQQRQTNIGSAQNDFLEHQTEPRGIADPEEFLSLVERKGLSLNRGGGVRQITDSTGREHYKPSGGGDGVGVQEELGAQIMDHGQHEDASGLLSLVVADTVPLGLAVRSETHKSRKAEQPGAQPGSVQPSATVTTRSTPGARSAIATASGDILRSSGTNCAAQLKLRIANNSDQEQNGEEEKEDTVTTTTGAVRDRRSLANTDLARNQRQQQQQPARVAISRATITNVQATDTFRHAHRRNEFKSLARKFDSGSAATQQTQAGGTLSSLVQPNLPDQTITTTTTTPADGKKQAAGGSTADNRSVLSSSVRVRSVRASGHKFVQPSRSSLSFKQQRSRSSGGDGAIEDVATIKLSHKDEQRNSGYKLASSTPINRSKRQDSTPLPLPPPIQLDRGGPEAREPPISGATSSRSEETVDPERSGSPSVADDETPAPQPICRAKSIYISPKAAMNHKKQWKYVVNAPERDPRIKQIIRVDICEAPFEPCSGDVTLPLGFASQCKQKYAKKKLLALDARSGLLEVDTFFIPSCCVCQLIPAIARFGLDSTQSDPNAPPPGADNNDDRSTPTTTMIDNSEELGAASPELEAAPLPDSMSGDEVGGASTDGTAAAPADTNNSGGDDNSETSPRLATTVSDNSNEGR